MYIYIYIHIKNDYDDDDDDDVWVYSVRCTNHCPAPHYQKKPAAPWGHVPQESVKGGDFFTEQKWFTWTRYPKPLMAWDGLGLSVSDWTICDNLCVQMVSFDVISAEKKAIGRHRETKHGLHNQLDMSQPLRMARPGHSLHSPVNLLTQIIWPGFTWNPRLQRGWHLMKQTTG